MHVPHVPQMPFADDLRYVLRSLRRSPGFTATVVLSFALGIGANAAMFGIINRVLLRGPEHVTDVNQVRRLRAKAFFPGLGDETTSIFGYVSYAILRDQARTIERVAGYSWAYPHSLGKGPDARKVSAGYATWDMFPLLGVRPALGRFFSAGEDRPPVGAFVVVLSYGLWQSDFAGDTKVLGSTILVNGKPYTVVGVAPRDFTGPDLSAVDAWLPMTLTGSGDNWWTSWNSSWLQILVRVKPDVPAAAVDNEVTQLQHRNYTGYGGGPFGKATFFVTPLDVDENGRERQEVTVSRWLSGVSLVVLLIACANVMNLMLARATRRRREVAVRLAMGISRARLVRLLVTESLVLAFIASVVALLFAHWGGAAIRGLLLPYVWWPGGSVNSDVLLFSAALTAVVGVVVGLAPAAQARSLDLTQSLKAGTQQAGAQRSSLQTTLLFVQSALSVVLLIGAGLFLHSLTRARGVDLGFSPERYVEARLNLPSDDNASVQDLMQRNARERETYRRVVERLHSMKDVSSAAIAVGSPFGMDAVTTLRVPGRDSIPRLASGGPFISTVSAGYFEATGTRLLSGRLFTDADREGSERVTVVNETMARTLWPDRAAIGECIQIGMSPCSRVVGIVGDVRRHALREAPVMQYYVPTGQQGSFGGAVLVVRPSGDPAAFMPVLQRVIREVAGVSAGVKLKQDDVDGLSQSWRAGTLLFGIFGGVALAIAAIGLYSVIAYLVAQRTHEFGVRLALGATARRVITMVLSRGVTVALVGLVSGIAVALGAGKFLEPLLFETTARDPLVLGGVSIVLLVVTVVACLVPARRAAAVDPIEALRAE
jgi:predicted permease